MTATPILEQLAREFSSTPECMSTVLELIDAGLSPPYIGRVRRTETGGLSESIVRRVFRRRGELEELDRRRGTILRMLEGNAGIEPSVFEEIRACMDRFELEDLMVPHRRPEPEVQLALDRGLGALADELIAPVPRAEGEADDVDADADLEAASELHESEVAPEELHAAHDAGDDAAAHETEPTDHAPSSEAAVEEAPVEEEDGASEAAEVPESTTGAPEGAVETTLAEAGPLSLKVELTLQLARLCRPYVDPNKGVHSEEEALSGATRILSDRLGRNARLRSLLRRMLRKNGVLTVRATADEKSLGRHRSLLKLKQPLRQLQGHRLLAIRQAQKDRMLATVISLEREKALPRVRAVFGKRNRPEFAPLLDAVAERALRARLLPIIEEDVRLELKERGDDEALRLLSQHLRQVLLAPPGPRVPVAGLDVNAKGDWTLAVVSGDGEPTGVVGRIEPAEKTPEALGQELETLLAGSDVHVVALGGGKGARAAITVVRRAVASAGREVAVVVVNDVGLSSYVNSELARKELAEHPVPVRLAIGLARRFRDPLVEMLKVDPRHMRLGPEQALVSKANLRRAFEEVVESCVAHAGCDVNRAPFAFLRHVPGLDAAAAERIIAHRSAHPITNREELRAEGLLSEAQWKSAIAFLRVFGGSERLDSTSLHPDQYVLVRRIAEACGGSIEDVLGSPGATRGLRRSDFEADEATWRDLMREISYPGRDPRLRNFIPNLRPVDTDPKELQKDDVVEGTVFNVASFGAFVDLGIAKDGMIHISEVSDRYVRDARELLAVGQSVRCRVLDSSGQRIALSLKRVIDRKRVERSQPGGGRDRGARRRDGEQGKEGSRFAQKRPDKAVRAAQSRRDGLVTGGGSERRGGRGGGRGGGSREGGRTRDEPYDRQYAKPGTPAYNPFASFFKDRKPEQGEEPAAEE